MFNSKLKQIKIDLIKFLKCEAYLILKVNSLNYKIKPILKINNLCFDMIFIFENLSIFLIFVKLYVYSFENFPKTHKIDLKQMKITYVGLFFLAL